MLDQSLESNLNQNLTLTPVTKKKKDFETKYGHLVSKYIGMIGLFSIFLGK